MLWGEDPHPRPLSQRERGAKKRQRERGAKKRQWERGAKKRWEAEGSFRSLAAELRCVDVAVLAAAFAGELFEEVLTRGGGVATEFDHADSRACSFVDASNFSQFAGP